MAIALSLVADLLVPLQNMVEWLAGGPSPRGPQRTEAAPRSARVVRVAAGGIVVSGRIDEVRAELDRLSACAKASH